MQSLTSGRKRASGPESSQQLSPFAEPEHPLAIATHTHHWPAESGTVPKARLRKCRCTTAPCSPADNATATHSQRFENAAWNAEAVAERALKQLNSCVSTSTVKAAMRALQGCAGRGPAKCPPARSARRAGTDPASAGSAPPSRRRLRARPATCGHR